MRTLGQVKRYFLLAAIVCMWFAMNSIANAEPIVTSQYSQITMTNSSARKTQDLSGDWHYSVDPYRVGEMGFHGGPPSPRAIRYYDKDNEAALKENPQLLIEQDMNRAPKIAIPGAWNSTQTEFRHYDELMWYRKHFDSKTAPDERAFLHFDGVNYKAAVYVNGDLIGKHEGGFTPFSFEITDKLRAGENQITIGVDCVHTAQSVPPIITDWDLYCGITRPVKLVYTPQTFINSAQIKLLDNGNLGGKIALSGVQKAHKNIEISIPELRQKAKVKSDTEGIAEFEIKSPRGLKKWSPESPKLYNIEFAAANDRLIDRVGFRTIKVDGTRLLLNGEPIFLRGISMHEEELGPNPSRNMTKEAAHELFTHIKTGLNGNFVRLAHYTHAETTLRLADEMGLLVWAEIPVYWTVDFTSQHSLNVAQTAQSEAIMRDYNRASIFVWSVANETPETAVRLSFLSKLVNQARELDNSRLISAALFSTKKTENGRTVLIVDDPLAAELDLLAVNTYNGWYSDDLLTDLPNFEWRSVAAKPLIFSEFGADAKIGIHGDANYMKFSEEYQALYFQETLKMAEKIPFLVGMSPWILKDFRSPRRQHPIYQEGWNRKGLLSETGQKKQAFEVLSKFYKAKAEKALSPR